MINFNLFILVLVSLGGLEAVSIAPSKVPSPSLKCTIDPKVLKEYLDFIPWSIELPNKIIYEQDTV